MTEQTDLPPKIVRAFKPGDIVFIETSTPMTDKQMRHVTAQFKKMLPELKVVVLKAGLRLAAQELPPTIGYPQDGSGSC